MNYSKNTILRMIICFFLITVPICIIFYFSNQPGTQSYGISNKVSTYIAIKWNKIFNLNLTDSSMKVLITSLYMPTRKLAHIIEYTVLGVFVSDSIYLYHRRIKLSKIFITMILILIIASCDEIHQAFIMQRGSHITDVCIDFVSGTVGIYLFIILKDFYKKVKYVINQAKKLIEKRRKTVLD